MVKFSRGQSSTEKLLKKRYDVDKTELLSVIVKISFLEGEREINKQYNFDAFYF